MAVHEVEGQRAIVARDDPMSGVEYRGIEMRFGDVTALAHLDMRVSAGGFLVLLGPSGCGKTTALRILAGLEQPTAGHVFLNDEDITHRQPRDRDIAMVFQSYALYPHMSVEENLAYPLRIRKRNAAERRQLVDHAAQLLDIGHLLKRRPRHLSGGQRQRVALGRAIVREPACFLMDEPLSNLDAQLRVLMRGEIKRLQQELGTTTLYVTHDQAEAMTMADQVAVMNSGRLDQLASPDEIYDYPASQFVARFVGSPPMNVLPGVLDSDRQAFVAPGGDLPLSHRRFSACAEAGVVEMGVRPEDLELVGCDRPGALMGEVYVVEPMGSETIVEVDVAGSRVRVRTERAFRARIGSPVGVLADANRACFFAPDGRTVIQREDAAITHEADVL